MAPIFCAVFSPILKVLPFFRGTQQSKRSLVSRIYTFCFTKVVISILPFGYFRAQNRCHIFYSSTWWPIKVSITTAAENNFTFIYYFVIFIVFFSETVWPVFTRFQIGPSVKGILSIYSNGSASLNKMATMPIYGEKHLKIFFSRTKKASRQNLVTEHWGLKVIQVCSNDNPRLTFDLFTARSNLRPYAFVWGKYWKFNFSKYIRDQ